MAISDSDIAEAIAAYLEIYPDEAADLAEPIELLGRGENFAWRRTFPMHATAGALLVRDGEILLVEHRAYGLTLQPGGHLEPESDASLVDAALRELAEETGLDPSHVVLASPIPSYIEFGAVPARPNKDEPPHFHLDFGFAFTTTQADIGDLQASEVTGAAWYPLAEAERRVGPRIARAISTPAR
ncbi:NUDIX hydrolase [Nocardia amamiensis]|uniref:NUDIX hydrolase n=1 Tax=Nocardia amamiensis TaxID=404578 RepID=UPI00082E0941|nr:NUDIX domain-containing protein [Nocardia amamiensis]